MIRVLSFDLDNRLFNQHYFRFRRKTDQRIVASNIPLLDAIKSENDDFEKNIVMIGSARQSH